jgi:transposase-like protein
VRRPVQRYLLPGDLAGALRHLEDRAIDDLLAAVTAEAKRRRRPSAQLATPKMVSRSQANTEIGDPGGTSLTRGQLSAVRAGFRAGVKPSTLARQFGLSQSDVRKALAAEGRPRKS